MTHWCSRTGRYAIQAVVFLAQSEGQRWIDSGSVASACDIPATFIVKVLKLLVDADILRSSRGPQGGYRLARPVEKITLLEVVEAVEGPIRGETPPHLNGLTTDLMPAIQVACDSTAALLRKALGRVKMASLAGEAVPA